MLPLSARLFIGHLIDRVGTYTEPLFLSCSEVDHTFDGPSRRRALDILQAEKATYHYQLFSGVEHGFALRGNPDDPYQRQLLFTADYEIVVTD